MSKRKWYEIRAAADDEAEVLIYDEIGLSWFGDGIEAKQFVEDLNEIEASTINVRINSPGGSVFEGLAIHNALERHPARVVTHVDGIAASIASVIAMAGDEVRMAENAFLMVHNAHGVAIGNAHDMREMADTLEKVTGSLIGVYAKRTGLDRAEIAALLDGETWLNAEEAADKGFVDAVEDAREVKAAFDLSRFEHPPEALKAKSGKPAPAAVDADEVRAVVEEVLAATAEPEPEAAGPDPAAVQVAAEFERIRMEAMGA